MSTMNINIEISETALTSAQRSLIAVLRAATDVDRSLSSNFRALCFECAEMDPSQALETIATRVVECFVAVGESPVAAERYNGATRKQLIRGVAAALGFEPKIEMVYQLASDSNKGRKSPAFNPQWSLDVPDKEFPWVVGCRLSKKVKPDNSLDDEKPTDEQVAAATVEAEARALELEAMADLQEQADQQKKIEESNATMEAARLKVATEIEDLRHELAVARAKLAEQKDSMNRILDAKSIKTARDIATEALELIEA